MNSATIPTFLFWGADLIVMCNKHCSETMGPLWKQSVGKPYKDAYPDQLEYAKILLDVVDTGHSISFNKQITFLDKGDILEEKYFSYSGHPIYNGQGIIEGTIGQQYDVTDEVVAERRIKMLSSLGKNTTAVKDENEFWIKCMESLEAAQ